MRFTSPNLRFVLKVSFGLSSLLVWLPAAAVHAQNPGYHVAVVSESGDMATWLTPSGPRLTPERIVPIGVMPSDIDGPHNITVSADGKSYYITVAHGTPFGSLWKLDTQNDSVLGKSQVELFPTTVSLTPDGQLAFVANSDFHGDHPRTNVISVIHTPTMTKITDLEACDMPHGVKVNHAGTRAYVSCMHSDEILELEVATLTLTRRARTGAAHAKTALLRQQVNARLRSCPSLGMTNGSSWPAMRRTPCRSGTPGLSGQSRKFRWAKGPTTSSPLPMASSCW